MCHVVVPLTPRSIVGPIVSLGAAFQQPTSDAHIKTNAAHRNFMEARPVNGILA
jgi:hypothetical protein